MRPEIGICGKSRSGKDTFAELMGKHLNVVPVALADPLKRLCMDVFDFSYDTLWGASELRNVPDRRYSCSLDNPAFASAYTRLLNHSSLYVKSWYPSASPEFRDLAAEALSDWFEALVPRSAEGLMPRIALQLLGTEVGRSLNENTWVDYAGLVVDRLLGGGWTYNKTTGLVRDEHARPPDVVALTDLRFVNEVLAVKARGGMAIKVVNPEQPTGSVGIVGHSSETAQDSIPERWFDAVVVNDKRMGLPAFESKVKCVVDTLFPMSRF